jgi:hypothetical protein
LLEPDYLIAFLIASLVSPDTTAANPDGAGENG